MTDVRQSLIDLGWEQGALVSADEGDQFGEFAHFDLGKGNLYLVISQTCDLVNPDFDIEPFVEVLRLTPLESEPANEAIGGKNSRVLQFQIDIEGVPRSFQALPFERFFVDRQLLLEFSAVAHVDDESRGMINAWLTKRFVRAAFPDSFDKRWKQRRKQIEKIIKRLKRVCDIYIKIEPFSEVDDDIDYDLELYLLMNAEDFDDPDIHREYTAHKKDLEDQFNQCPNLDLQEIELVSDAEITLREIQQLRRWDYSYLSYRDPGDHVSPALETV